MCASASSSAMSDHYALCPYCGTRRVAAKLSNHVNTPPCLVAQIATAMTQLGFERCGHFSTSIKRAGITVLYAPVDWEYPDKHDKRTPYERLINGPWAPERAVLAAQALHRVRVTPEQRARFIQRVAEDDALYQRVDSVLRLGAAVPKEWFTDA